jgi:hypothetical protein
MVSAASPRYWVYAFIFFFGLDYAEKSLSTVSEIAVMRCMFDMSMMDICAPPHTVADDAIKGKWVRVPRDLNLQNGMWELVRKKLFLIPLAMMETEMIVITAHVLPPYSPTRRRAHLGHTTASR